MGSVDVAGGLRGIGLELNLDLSSTQLDQLTVYVSLLERWNAVYNLTAVRGVDAMLSQHLADCLAIVGPLRRHFMQHPPTAPSRLLDVGSGAGLPGIVLAIVMPELQVVCVDTVAKKASFMRQAAGELGLSARLQAQHQRVESMDQALFDIVTARAFSSLADLAELTRHLLKPDGVWLAMKGRLSDREIEALPSFAEMFHVEHLTVPGLDAERCIGWMRLRKAPSS